MTHFSPTPRTTDKFQKSLNDFRSARQRAALENVVARLTGKSTALLSYNDITNKLKIVNQAGRGIRDIPVEAIVGSVGRYTDFSRSFLPTQEKDANRWARVASVPDFNQLPPIDVYQIGEVYFVLDGNHRVSIARQRGMLFIPAEVTEVRTRAPIPPDVSPDKLILQAEYGAFLENTDLDKLRPDASLLVSVPGQYRKLENHMEVHRFFVEMAEDVALSDAQAVTRWYDEAYLPVVEAVREQGLLRGFPHRTETDLYLWISEHQAQLRNELGWQVRPEVAAANLAGRVEPKKVNRVTRIGKKFGRRVLNLVVPNEAKREPAAQSWSQMKVAARYSDRLFADLLVVLGGGPADQAALEQALAIATRDNSQLHGLYLEEAAAIGTSFGAGLGPKQTPGPALKSWFEEQCQEAGVQGRLGFQSGSVVETICSRAALADLVVAGRLRSNSETTADHMILSLIRQSPRPVLVAADQPAAVDRVVLVYDGDPKSREALFAAAYMAERWGVSLTVVLPPEAGDGDEAAVEHARRYLAMHEVEADYRVSGAEAVQFIMTTANECQAQLIIAGGMSERRFGSVDAADLINQLVTAWRGAVFICP